MREVVAQVDEISSHEEDIASLEEEIAALQAAEHEHDAAVAALNEELEARRDRLAVTRQALADFQQRMHQKRAQLDEAMADEARRAFEQVMQEREEAGRSVAEAAELLLERLHALDQLQETAKVAWKTAASRSSAIGRLLEGPAAKEIETQPEAMRESWGRLCEEIRQRINEQFEEQLVEAAMHKPDAIKDLPVHLQELARQRLRSRRSQQVASVPGRTAQ